MHTKACRAELWLVRELKKEKKTWIKTVLWFLSQLYRAAVFGRNCLFELGLLKRVKVKKPVISIGSVVAGGSGKTTLTYFLAKELNLPVAILNRGYRARKAASLEKIVSTPEEGDEAYLIAQKVPFATVFVGKKRTSSAKMAENLHADYILLDDGMQYRYLHRDVEIVVLHVDTIFGGDHFLPRGFLRDSPKRLAKADAIFVNGAETEEAFHKAVKLLRHYTNALLIGVHYDVVDKEKFRDKKVGAFCGIGNPDSFYKLLHSVGARIVTTETLPDHASFDRVDEFLRASMQKGADFVVCTEKDAIKLERRKEIIPLEIEMRITFGKVHFEALLKKLKGMIAK